MITSLSFKLGRTPFSIPEHLEITPITVFVGPNNSGKSKVLQELHMRCTIGTPQTTDVILNDVTFAEISIEEARKRVDSVRVDPTFGQSVQLGDIIVGKRGETKQISEELLVSIIRNPSSNINLFANYYLRYDSIYLGGGSRMGLVAQQSAGDLQAPPVNSLQVLFRDDAKRKEVRRIVHEAFGQYLVVDPTHVGQLRLRFSTRPPRDDTEERGLHDQAVQFHSQAPMIETFSDGVRSFTGMLIEFIAGNPEVIFVDEPEAFLHPSLAYKLGLELARTSLGSRKRLFASTHSPNFVMGCIQSGAPINIIRLTYQAGQGTARVLRSEELLKLMRNPLLRSTGVLSALFYEHVVVTESDADRAFYQEINERLLRADPGRAIPNCLFINAQNKQTVHSILRPLRELGIPAVGIVDVDVLKDGGTVWTKFLQGGAVPELAQQSLSSYRTAVKAAMDATNLNMKRDGGVAILQGDDKVAVDHLLDQLDEHGLFVVRGGELESWLKFLGAAGHGPSWLMDVFEKMGEDPTAPDYLQPGAGDVWEFMSNIRTWMMNPRRKGIPV